MTASQRRTVIVSMAALGVAFMLVWAASTGPTGVVGGSHRTSTTSSPASEAPLTRPASPEPRDAPPKSDHRSGATGWLNLATYVGVLGGLWVTMMLLRVLMLKLASRLPEKQLVLDLDPLPDVKAARESLSEDQERHLAALTGGDIRSGIVACWVLLEEAAARAGVSRLPAETATEFVVRFLHALDVDPRPVATLAGLYHEARFSSHPMPAERRTRAEDALAGIHRDLDRSPAS